MKRRWHFDEPTPPEVWEAAAKLAENGEHLVAAVIEACARAWDGTGQEYEQEAPEVRALRAIREQEGAEQGSDYFAAYTPDQAAAALRRAAERTSP